MEIESDVTLDFAANVTEPGKPRIERKTDRFPEEEQQLSPRLSRDDGKRRLRVAVLDEELPYPTTTGKRIRTYNLLTQLASRHEITFLCYRNHDPAEIPPALAHFEELGIRVVMNSEPPPRQTVLLSRFELGAKLLRNLISRQPFLVENHVRSSYVEMVRRYASDEDVDIWHCEWTPYARVMALLPLRPWVVVAHNVESLIWQRYFETERNPLKRWYIGLQWYKFRRFESWSFRTTSRLVTVSQPDADLAVRHFTAQRPIVVDNGVDTKQIVGPTDPRDTDSILFLGSLDWRPNLDGVTQLLDDIFPRVLSRRPTARLQIVGRKPPKWLVDRIAREKNVELHADVPSVRPFLHGCGVMAVPLRIGGGSRLKILEALAAEMPVVSTTVGAEGLHVQNGDHLTLADSPDEMAQALMQTLEQPEQFVEQARRGRQLVEQQYDWSVLAEKLDDVWRQVESSEKKPIRVLELRAAEGAGGGPEKTILQGAAIADEPIDVTVCYISHESDERSPIADRANEMGVPFVRLRQRSMFDLGLWRRLVELVRSRRINIVHAHDYKTNFLALALRRVLGVQIMSTAHGWTGNSKREQEHYYPLDRRMLRRFTKVLAVSSEIAETLKQSGVDSERIMVLPNGIDPELFQRQPNLREATRERLDIAETDFVLGSVGRLAHQKRFDLLIKAFARLLPEFPQLRLVIAGEGPERPELESLIAKYDSTPCESDGQTAPAELSQPSGRIRLADRVTLLGNCPDIVPIYHALDAFVQSSEYEGTPNVVLEAMALEVPIVATRAGGTTDVLRPDQDGIVVPCGSVEELVLGIQRLLGDPDSARRRAESARRYVTTKLSFVERTRRMEAVYDQLLRGGP